MRAGNLATDPIRLYNFNLQSWVGIATSAQFAALGQSPGVSANAEVVAFYGDLTAAGATSLGTTAGPGIFASVLVGPGSTRRIVRLTSRQVENAKSLSRNDDGVCDTWELNIPLGCATGACPCVTGELGRDVQGLGIEFSSTGYQPNARVGVVYQSQGAAGVVDDTFGVTFLGTPTGNDVEPKQFSSVLGLWTLRVDMKNDFDFVSQQPALAEKPRRAEPVIQVGDVIGQGGTGPRTITGIQLYDPIALALHDDAGVPRTQRTGDHRVAFMTTTAQGPIVVRASHLDSDEDALLDHWEAPGIDGGIDYDGNGSIDLRLASLYGVRPDHKDLLVEIDFMVAADHDHLPSHYVLPRIHQAFRAAPVANPDLQTGINLKLAFTEGDPIEEVTPLTVEQREPGPLNDFDDLKLGEPRNPCPGGSGTQREAGHFGTAEDRRSPNCMNILGARRLTFRYAILSHFLRYPLPFGVDHPLGYGELLGDDFSVAIGKPLTDPPNVVTDCVAGESVDECKRRTVEESALMHEFGHTLGLGHGGLDSVNCKPNYLSIMNYAIASGARDPDRPFGLFTAGLADEW